MARIHEDKPERGVWFGWKTIAFGDNGIDLLQYVIKVHNFAEAAAIGSDIAGLLVRYEQKSDASFNQVTLRSWQVEITMAVPREGLLPKSQQEFLDAVNACYSSR